MTKSWRFGFTKRSAIGPSQWKGWVWTRMDVSENSGFPPKSSIFNMVFHYFHHPFWGTSYFWKHPYGKAGFLCFGGRYPWGEFFIWISQLAAKNISNPRLNLPTTKTRTTWWLNQPLWKILVVKLGSILPSRGEHKIHLKPPPSESSKSLLNP